MCPEDEAAEGDKDTDDEPELAECDVLTPPRVVARKVQSRNHTRLPDFDLLCRAACRRYLGLAICLCLNSAQPGAQGSRQSLSS